MPTPLPTRNTLSSLVFYINWKMAALAAFTAITIWTLNALNKRYNTQLSLPITLDYNAEGLITVRAPQDKIDLSVTGAGWDLLQRSSNIKADPLFIYLERPTQIKFLLPSTLSRVFTPQLNPIRLNYVSLDTLFFDIQRRVHKTLQIHLDSTAVRLREDYRITSPIRIVPDTFLLSGPEQKIALFSNTYMLRLDTEQEIEAPFKERIAITLAEPMFHQAHPPDVEVSFTVAHFEQKTIQVPLERSGFPRWQSRQIVLSDTLITLRYTAPSEHIPLITPERFTLVVNYADRDRKNRTLIPVLISYPEEYISEIEILLDAISYSYARY